MNESLPKYYITEDPRDDSLIKIELLCLEGTRRLLNRLAMSGKEIDNKRFILSIDTTKNEFSNKNDLEIFLKGINFAIERLAKAEE
jgi:hypothetical protein